MSAAEKSSMDIFSTTSSSLFDWAGKHHVILELSLEGMVENASEKYMNLLGHPGCEVIGLSFSSLIKSSTPELVWDSVVNNFARNYEFSLLNINGVEVWITGYFHFAGNNSKKIIFMGNDISELKDELNARNRIMNITSIVSESDLKGNITSINEKFCEVSKYSEKELIGMPHNTTRHPDMDKEVFRQMWKTIGSGNTFKGMVKNRAKDGTAYYVDAAITPIIGKNGKPRKYLGIRYDITVDETERQNMRGLFKAINSSFTYVEYSLDGQIASANDMLNSRLGKESAQLIGKSFAHESVVVDAGALKASAVWPTILEGKSLNLVLRRMTASNEEVFYQSVLAPVTDEMGRVLKIVELSTDITELNRMLDFIRSTSKEVDEVYTGIESVSTSIEEMVASIKDISRSTNESSNMTRNTLLKAQKSNEIVTKLGSSSQEVGDVIKVISSIAQQTNLLALNATIEAARAGETGKGFAVVANEVKELAKQTAKATDDITKKISTMQSDTGSAIDSIVSIFDSVEMLSNISNTIASAVEEQTATTAEISRVMIDSKKGVERIETAIRMASETKV